MTPAQRAQDFYFRAACHCGQGGPPFEVLHRTTSLIDAGAATDSLLLLADRGRAVAEHLRHLGADRMSERFHQFGAEILHAAEAAQPEEADHAT